MRLACHSNPELTAAGERSLNAGPDCPAGRRALAGPRRSLNQHHRRVTVAADEISLARLIPAGIRVELGEPRQPVHEPGLRFSLALGPGGHGTERIRELVVAGMGPTLPDCVRDRPLPVHRPGIGIVVERDQLTIFEWLG